jgi:hypothetical protein
MSAYLILRARGGALIAIKYMPSSHGVVVLRMVNGEAPGGKITPG